MRIGLLLMLFFLFVPEDAYCDDDEEEEEEDKAVKYPKLGNGKCVVSLKHQIMFWLDMSFVVLQVKY
jgi:hypothetical protein